MAHQRSVTAGLFLKQQQSPPMAELKAESIENKISNIIFKEPQYASIYFVMIGINEVLLMNLGLNYNGNKGFRLLMIYERLNKGELLNKIQLANDFKVTPKTVQRDIDDLRAYLAETHFAEGEISIKYDKIKNGYYLIRFEREWLTNEEVLAVCKILLESRAFEKDELAGLVHKLLAQVAPDDRKTVNNIIKNEYHYYVPLKHGKKLLTPIWELSGYISNSEIISFQYTRLDDTFRTHEVKPVAIMFSEFYFYLIAFMADGSKKDPTVFRIDRIERIVGTKKRFAVPYSDKFSDGEFRKRVQFMYSGTLRCVTFEFKGPSIEAILDRLPTARILYHKDGVYRITAECYGDGVLMWLRSQGDWIKILDEPKETKDVQL